MSQNIDIIEQVPIFQILWSATSDTNNDNFASIGLGWSFADMFSAQKQNHWISISVSMQFSSAELFFCV